MFTEYQSNNQASDNGNGLVKVYHAVAVDKKEPFNAGEAIRTLPVDVLIRDFVTSIKRMRKGGVPIAEIAGTFGVHRSSVDNWLSGKQVPHSTRWPGHTIYDYVDKMLKGNERLIKLVFGDDTVIPENIDTNNNQGGMAGVNSVGLFSDVKQVTLITNFVDVIKLVASEYSVKYTAYENIAVVFNCHPTTVANWISGKTSPHSIFRPNQTIYHRIDMLRKEYGNKFDGILRNDLSITTADVGLPITQTINGSDNSEHKLGFIAFCKALKHVREKVDCVSHKQLADIIGIDGTILHEYISVNKGVGDIEIPTEEELAGYVKRFRNRFGGKYDHILNNRKHPELLARLGGQEPVTPVSDNGHKEVIEIQTVVIPQKPALKTSIFERRQSSGQLTVVEAKLYLERRLAEIATDREDILNKMAALETRDNELNEEDKDAKNQLSVLNKILGLGE